MTWYAIKMTEFHNNVRLGGRHRSLVCAIERVQRYRRNTECRCGCVYVVNASTGSPVPYDALEGDVFGNKMTDDNFTPPTSSWISRQPRWSSSLQPNLDAGDEVDDV